MARALTGSQRMDVVAARVRTRLATVTARPDEMRLALGAFSVLVNDSVIRTLVGNAAQRCFGEAYADTVWTTHYKKVIHAGLTGETKRGTPGAIEQHRTCPVGPGGA